MNFGIQGHLSFLKKDRPPDADVFTSTLKECDHAQASLHSIVDLGDRFWYSGERR